MNPYTGQNIFTFFGVFLQRLFSGMHPLATDEIQLIVLSGIALSCALVGTFLMLRKMTMLANAMSHTVLLGIVIAYLLLPKLEMSTLMIAALITGLVTTCLTQFLTRLTRLQEDASIGLIFTLLFAIGLLLVTLYTRNLHIGTELIMGNADALQLKDIRIVWSSLGINLVLITLFYRGYQITTFDPNLARSLGFSPMLFHYLLMVQTSLTAISAFRSIGVFMVLAFLIAPTLIAHLFTQTLSKLLLIASLVSVGAVFIGVALSRHILTYYGIGVSTGGIVVSLLFVFYLAALTFRQFLLTISHNETSRNSRQHRLNR